MEQLRALDKLTMQGTSMVIATEKVLKGVLRQLVQLSEATGLTYRQGLPTGLMRQPSGLSYQVCDILLPTFMYPSLIV